MQLIYSLFFKVVAILKNNTYGVLNLFLKFYVVNFLRKQSPSHLIA